MNMILMLNPKLTGCNEKNYNMLRQNIDCTENVINAIAFE